MRLLKVIAYTLLGYVIYELYRGMKQAGPAVAHRGRGNGRAGHRRADQPDRPVSGTSLSGGQTVGTEDLTGAHMRHVVGRGVLPA